MKKLLALLLLVCLGLTETAAFAFPSKTADDLTAVSDPVSAAGTVLAEEFVLAATEPTGEIAAAVAAICAHVAENPIASWLPGEVQAAIGDLGFDAAALIGYEAVAVACENYEAVYGDVSADMTFATVFPEGCEVIVLISTADWSVQKAVAENGAVRVVFTADELTFMEETPALVLVLAGEIAE